MGDEAKTVHPYCNACGWRKGGVDSWNGFACKCGHSEAAIKRYAEPAQLTKLGPSQTKLTPGIDEHIEDAGQ